MHTLRDRLTRSSTRALGIALLATALPAPLAAEEGQYWGGVIATIVGALCGPVNAMRYLIVAAALAMSLWWLLKAAQGDRSKWKLVGIGVVLMAFAVDPAGWMSLIGAERFAEMWSGCTASSIDVVPNKGL